MYRRLTNRAKPARTRDMNQPQTLPIAEAAPLGIGFGDGLDRPELRCFKCNAPAFVVSRKIYDGSPVMAACKQHQDLLRTKLKWQIEPMNK